MHVLLWDGPVLVRHNRQSFCPDQNNVGKGGGGGGGGVMDPIKSESAVKVVTSIRPLLPGEADCKDILTIIPPARVELPKKPKGSGTEDKYPFDFDRVVRADTALASKEMYAALVLPVVERFCQGFNATVLAYGQTVRCAALQTAKLCP